MQGERYGEGKVVATRMREYEPKEGRYEHGATREGHFASPLVVGIATRQSRIEQGQSSISAVSALSIARPIASC